MNNNAKSENDPVADPMALMHLLWPGPLVVQAINTAAHLRIADRLAESSQTTENLAASASVPSKTLGRLLTALTSVGVFGAGFFEYLKANPKVGTWFNQAMAAQSTGVLDEIPAAYDFSAFNSIADLGGGTGSTPSQLALA